MNAVRLIITGRVQGVGYRDWAIRTARNLGLRGWVRNRSDESVEAMVAGDDAAVAAMIEACRRGPRLARVDTVDVQPADAAGVPEGFTQLPTA
jgi:acylphosphatase